MPPLPDIAGLFVFPLFLVFARVGAALMIFPSVSDPSVNTRTRLMVAIGVALALWPAVTSYLPALPTSTGQVVAFLVVEIALGILLGLGARVMMGAMNLAGELIAFATGLQAATLFDPINNSNTTTPTLFLMMLAAVLVFITNLHHTLIAAVVKSYSLLPAGQLPPVADALEALLRTIQVLMVLGLQLSAPVVVVGFLGYVMFGVLNRLVPQLQVFFVSVPLQIFGGMLVLAASLSLMLTLFMAKLEQNMLLLNQ